jgi:two-component system sensor histidine kinase BaeS
VRLRLRLALTTLIVLLPIGFGLNWFNDELRDRAGEEALANGALSYMRAGGRARCEAAPDSWGGPTSQSAFDAVSGHHPGATSSVLQVPWQVHWGPPATLYAYDAGFRPLGVAPELPEGFAAAVREGRGFVARRTTHKKRAVVEVLATLEPRGERCAYVFARGPAASPRTLSTYRAAALVGAPLVVFFVGVLIAVGPLVTRVRRLTDVVRRSARGGYTDTIGPFGRDEIGQLARAFEQAGGEIRAQLREKERREQALREFVANTTHDMMIPLTVLQGHLAALKDQVASGQGIDERALASTMDEAHYMGALMHNLAIAAKLDASRPELLSSRVDLNALVARVMGRHSPIANQLKVSLDSAVPEQPVITRGDVTLLEQAVSNVVYNAIRHNRQGGHAAVILETASEQFRLRVVDDGPGIPEADLCRLVERGFRGASARTRTPEGQGLGLNITFQVAKLHALELTIKPSEYGGLELELRGPLCS